MGFTWRVQFYIIYGYQKFAVNFMISCDSENGCNNRLKYKEVSSVQTINYKYNVELCGVSKFKALSQAYMLYYC